MPMTVLQFDFPFSGPWGEEMGSALGDLARDIAKEPGLTWKMWTENRSEGRAGGIYLFHDVDHAQRYLAKHMDRLETFGVRDVSVRAFQVNQPLSAVTRAPV